MKKEIAAIYSKCEFPASWFAMIVGFLLLNWEEKYWSRWNLYHHKQVTISKIVGDLSTSTTCCCQLLRCCDYMITDCKLCECLELDSLLWWTFFFLFLSFFSFDYIYFTIVKLLQDTNSTIPEETINSRVWPMVGHYKIGTYLMCGKHQNSTSWILNTIKIYEYLVK